ncbi:ogr/Delta-like zinc finger family protein [Photobacterium angustum]|uniref:Transcriptional regulator n=1 Tax=Photobacterium angustum TaxID=661 RepID=A0A855SF43_PHOAN|nr:ogr/Delta-like zinc finger family protein [Photobacterium angustum]PSX08891.1 transcriptional regulator [Photobacterium angustum]PSX14241.1 transcriptional regulator [Photobacterium angustum]PSX23165.1 transcriptional regulator [Photobacterium angustum]PSX40379.1 transcriptional regulator [Photobacterium angustum]
MRVNCNECGAKARIQKTNWLSTKAADLYCSCSDAECGHTFVMNLGFSHTLSPSAKTTNEVIISLMKALSPDQKKQIQSQLSLL